MTEPDGRKSGIAGWKSIDYAAVFSALIFVGGFIWLAHTEIEKVNDKINDVSRQVSKLQTAVRLLGAKQGGDTKTLIDEALTAANEASADGRIESARDILGIANKMVEQEKKEHSVAGAEFFQAAIDQYRALENYPAIKKEATVGQVRLAEYKSSLNEQPALPNSRVDLAPAQILSAQLTNQIFLIKGQIYTHPGVNLLGTGLTTLESSYSDPSRDILVPQIKDWADNREAVIGINLIGASQTLDGFSWQNVTFIGVHIKVGSGAFRLSNVRFVNCTFDESVLGKASQVLSYVALGSTGDLTIG